MDLDLKIYVRMRRRGGSMGVRGAVLPGDFGSIRGLSRASRGELTERAPSLAL